MEHPIFIGFHRRFILNIDQFRAWKAEQESGEKESTAAVEKPAVTEVVEKEPIVEQKPVDKIKIGEEEVTIDELSKGYLRQRDYTKKTQELSRKSKEAEEALNFYQAVKTNPTLMGEISTKVPVPKTADPVVQKLMELERELYDTRLDAEIMRLEKRYPDFDEKEVIQFASQRGITDLEVAYKAIKGDRGNKETVDVEALKEQIKKDLIKEIEDERKATSTMISTKTSNKPVTDNKPKISKAEEAVAMRMFAKSKSPVADYVKWRDMK